MVAPSPEVSQVLGTTERTPNLIVRMRKLANPETRGRLTARTADRLLESMKRCHEGNPDCAYRQECLELWDTLSSPNVIPLRNERSVVDPTKGRAMPGDWMVASCSRVIQDERRN